MSFKVNISGLNDLKRRLEKKVDEIANDHQDKMEKDLRAFHAKQRGRPVTDIQRGFRAKYGNELSDDDAQGYSDGAPLTVTKQIKR